jgi:hypothetical protein
MKCHVIIGDDSLGFEDISMACIDLRELVVHIEVGFNLPVLALAEIQLRASAISFNAPRLLPSVLVQCTPYLLPRGVDHYHAASRTNHGAWGMPFELLYEQGLERAYFDMCMWL